MPYIDGTMIPVPVAKKEEYRAHAEKSWAIFKEYGALIQHEYWSNDIPEGKNNSMHTAVLRKEDEAVVYGWIVWPSKEARDAGWAKVMADPRMAEMSMPFDGARMIYGGFEHLFSGE